MASGGLKYSLAPSRSDFLISWRLMAIEASQKLKFAKSLTLRQLRTEDFLNALAALGHIKKDENGYSNTEETSTFCVKSSANNISSALYLRGSI